MSTMDRAFIKAYADDVPSSERTAAVKAPERAHSRPAVATAPRQPAAASTASMVMQVPQAMQKPVAQLEDRTLPAPHSRFVSASRGREVYESEARASAVVERPAAPMHRSTRPSQPVELQVPVHQQTPTHQEVQHHPVQQASVAQETSRMPLSAFTSHPKAEQRFRAGLEVDHFVWPTICAEMAANEHVFDGLAEELIDEAARGNKIIAISSCRRGEGRTSLLLCVARRLASSGVKVCVVDADLQNPQLSRRLGLAAQAGWESVITGELAVTEVLIDSIDDRLSLFPLKPAAQFENGLSPSQFAIMTGILRDHHDIVLVDTGPLLEGNQSGLHLMEEKSGVEALVLVSNVQTTSPEHLRQAQRLLSAARIKCVGIAENFVQS